MRYKYCCDNEKYKDYYRSQVGHGLSGFEGSRYQRGHGLGSLFKGLIKASAPILKKGALAMGRQALNMVQNKLADDGPTVPTRKRMNKKRGRGGERASSSRGSKKPRSERDIFSNQN